jgi:hypothetical protein
LPGQQSLRAGDAQAREIALARRVLQALAMRNLLIIVLLGTSACATSRPMSPARCNDVLARYAHGESLDKIAAELQLGDRDAARDAVHQAMLSLQKRYYHDR